MSSEHKFDMIVACDLNWGIGYKNNLLVKLPEDMELFKLRTIGNCIIMGNNTKNSLPRALPRRWNIVMSKSHDPGTAEGFTYVQSFEKLYSLLDNLDTINNSYPNDRPDNIVICGASIYKQFLEKNLIQHIFLTTFNHKFDNVDTFIPNLYSYGFKVNESSHLHMNTGYDTWTNSTKTFIDTDGQEKPYQFKIQTLVKE
jgi:dihydrofolate reductase